MAMTAENGSEIIKQKDNRVTQWTALQIILLTHLK